MESIPVQNPVEILNEISQNPAKIALDADEMIYLAAENRLHELGNKKIELHFELEAGMVNVTAFIFDDEFCIASMDSNPKNEELITEALNIIKSNIDNMRIVGVNATDESKPFLEKMVAKGFLTAWRFT